ncbi:hypothetical protein OROMI_020841 [Orobanche minor]
MNLQTTALYCGNSMTSYKVQKMFGKDASGDSIRRRGIRSLSHDLKFERYLLSDPLAPIHLAILMRSKTYG